MHAYMAIYGTTYVHVWPYVAWRKIGNTFNKRVDPILLEIVFLCLMDARTSRLTLTSDSAVEAMIVVARRGGDAG